MIKRTTPKYRKITENLQDNSFTGTGGIDISKSATSRETVYNMNNFEVDNDGGLRLRKPLVLKTNYYKLIGSKEILKIITLYDTNSKLIIAKQNNNYYLYCYNSEQDLLPISFYDNDSEAPLALITNNLVNGTKWESIDYINTFDSTVLTGVKVDLTSLGSKYYDPSIIEEANAKEAYRYFRLEIKNNSCCIYLINPEINNLNSQNTPSLNPNMSLDNAYAIRDNYSSQVVSCEGILAYTLCSKDNLGKPIPASLSTLNNLTVKVLTESNKDTSYKIISTVDKDFTNNVYLKAFLNIKAKSTTKLLCIWEKTYDGVNWEEVDSFYDGVADEDIAKISVKEKTIETINSSVNIYVTKRFRKLEISNENDLISKRPDCLKLVKIDDATYRFSIYNYEEYNLSSELECTYFAINNIDFTSSITNSDDISRLYQKELNYNDYYSRIIDITLKVKEYEVYKNANFSITSLNREYTYQNGEYKISETSQNLTDNAMIDANGVLELKSVHIASNLKFKNIWKNYATKLIVKADNVPIFITGFIEHYYIKLPDKSDMNEIEDIASIDYSPLEATGDLNGTFGGNVDMYHFQNTHTKYDTVKVLNTKRNIKINYNYPNPLVLAPKILDTNVYYFTKNVNKNCKIYIDWDYMYKYLSGISDHPQGGLTYEAFKSTFLKNGSITNCVLGISVNNLGQSYYVVNGNGSETDYISETDFNTIYNNGFQSYGYINATQGYTVEGNYLYTSDDTVYVIKLEDGRASYLSRIGTNLEYDGSIEGANIEPSTIDYNFDNLPTIGNSTILASNLINLDTKEYSLPIVNKTEVLYNEYGSSVAGEKLYYKKAIYSYGLEQFKNNVFPSDTGSFITSLFNVIELDVTDGSAVNIVIPWRDYLIAASDKSIYLITRVGTSYTTKTINTYIGIPFEDRKTCKAILNGLIFKSGLKLYSLQPNPYSSDDTILNIKEISTPIENYIIKTDYDNFAFTTEKAYYLFLPREEETLCLTYEYARGIWQKYTYPVPLIDYNLKSIDDIILIDKLGKEYYFNKELSEIPNSLEQEIKDNLPYADYIDYTLNDMEEFGTTDESSKYIPISYLLDSGQKTFNIVDTKQFVESKIILTTQTEQDIFPMELIIRIDGSPYPIRIDASTDAPLWKKDIWDRGSLSTNFISEETINNKTFKQGVFRYSGKGKSIEHLIQGNSIYNFKLYVVHYRFKNLINKK